jgi:hypothetical protein
VAEKLDGEELIAPLPLLRAALPKPLVLPSAAGIVAPQLEDLRPLAPFEDHPKPPDRSLDRQANQGGGRDLPGNPNPIHPPGEFGSWAAPLPSSSSALAEAAERENGQQLRRRRPDEDGKKSAWDFVIFFLRSCSCSLCVLMCFHDQGGKAKEDRSWVVWVMRFFSSCDSGAGGALDGVGVG